MAANDADYTADSKEVEDMQQQIKNLTAIIGAASFSANMTACMFDEDGSGSAGATTKNGGASQQLAEAATKKAITATFSAFGGPFSGMAASMVMNVATSFQPIDTCKNKSDADGRGGRHKATRSILRSKHPDMCKPTIVADCVQTNPVDGACAVKGYTYCCYDSPVARYLMAEIKAQLGKNWMSCSDLMIEELSDVNMRACTEEEKLDGIDGASDEVNIKKGQELVADGNFDSYYDMAQNTFYQAKHNCLNYERLKKYYNTEFEGMIDQDSLQKQLDQMFGGQE